MGLKKEVKESLEEKVERILDKNSDIKSFNYSYNELKSAIDIKKKIFLATLFVNLFISLATLFMLFQPTKISFFSSSYTAEIEKLTLLNTIDENGQIFVNYKLNDMGEEKSQIINLNKTALKGL